MSSDKDKFIYSNKSLISDFVESNGVKFFIFSQKRFEKQSDNEDSAAVFINNKKNQSIFVVADGMGGAPLGGKASEIVISTLASNIKYDNDNIRSEILDGFEKASKKIQDLKVGAGSTCALIEINGNSIRSYHSGDSSILITGQRGKIKFQSIPHSPVGYALEAGQINEEEALTHDELHEISNFIGHPEMRIDIGPQLKLSAHDTVLIGTDGLFDNLRTEEIIEIIKSGNLKTCGDNLISAVNQRMTEPSQDDPSKPDDVAFILYRSI